MDLVLIRHAQPEVAAGTCYGCLDLPLVSPLMPVAAQIVAGLPAPARIVSSPLARALGTAQALVQTLPAGVPAIPAIATEPLLRELDFGSWEGVPWDEIDRAALDQWAADLLHARPHGGESPAQAMARVAGWADALDVRDDCCVWVVGHAGPMRMLAAHWLGVPLAVTVNWALGFGASCRFRLGADGARLEWWNRT
ncbi:histidine phosphatase family protein [Cupriavidus oxalaticus]|uniref:Alpha-ribazole phosphatase n=1 Tax=Cupriavidus oxalaticus TaxID=96344 RepID=A0A4P7LDF1_9BURK|nr:histidine phosphatase family protein [Cupriavidus oxalaticus]QBY54076.1 alpha-ribazole phosphatase [Cupriavidus oxalaticus]